MAGMGALRTYPRSRAARASLEATLTSATAAPCPRLGWPETAVSARGKALRSPSMLEARAEPKKGRTDHGQARGVSRNIDRRAQGADQGRYPPVRDRSTGGWPRGGARPRGVAKIWIFQEGAVGQF